MSAPTIQSPDGKYAVERHDDFGEIAMGSPAFGHVTIHGTEGQIPDRLYGEAVVFSPDSRFVALEELYETTPFRTKLIAIELPRCKIFRYAFSRRAGPFQHVGRHRSDLFTPLGRSGSLRRHWSGTRHHRPLIRKDSGDCGVDAEPCI